jgi:hypothetical protein
MLLGPLPVPAQIGRVYRGTPSHVPCEGRRPGSRRLHAGHRLASTRAPARLIPDAQERPVLMPPDLNNDTSPATPAHIVRAAHRLPDPYLTPSRGAFSVSLTTTVFNQCSIRWFDALPRRTTPKGRNPSSLAQHCFQNPSYIEPLSHSWHTLIFNLPSPGVSCLCRSFGVSTRRSTATA